jgi:hypothetical protein
VDDILSKLFFLEKRIDVYGYLEGIYSDEEE